MLELRLAFRLLRKQPFVSLTILLTLGVGIGMAVTGFTLLDAVLFSRLPFPNGDRFVVVKVYTGPGEQHGGLDAARFRRLAEGASTLEHLGAFNPAQLNVQLRSGDLVPVAGVEITPASFAAFPSAPVLGRVLTPADAEPEAPPVVLLRESLWRRAFSADPRAIGALATISGVHRTIVGVMPDTVEFPNSGEVWIPLPSVGAAADRAYSSARLFGVLKRGTEPSAATAQLSALSQQYEAANGRAPHLRVTVQRFADAMSEGLDLLAGVLVACLVGVLSVIAANIATLVLARAVARARELAVRTALGASRARLIGQISAEVSILSLSAAAIGLTASQVALAWVRRTLTDIPFWIDFTAGPRTMAFAVGAAVLAAAIAGIAPALKATRRDPSAALASSGRTASAGIGRTTTILVALQVAVSIALLNGALVMARGVEGYMHPTVNVPQGEVLTARLWSETATADAIVDAVSRIPGVTAAGAGTSLPGLSPDVRMTEIDASATSAAAARSVPVVGVRRAFFETLGGRIEAGRTFTAADFSPGAVPVAIVNRPFASKFFGSANPVGRRLRIVSADATNPPEPWREIVGVVPDLGLSAGDASMAAGFYVPMDREAIFHIALRTRGDAARLTNAVRAALNDLDPRIQVIDVVPLEQVGTEDRAIFAGIGAALTALGGMALLLSIMGTYATLSMSVTRRTREIGIRAALGATPRHIVQSIIGRMVLAPAAGALGGVALGRSLVAARGIFAFRLPDGAGPWGLPVLAAIMIAAALLSTWVPARRALAIEPADALRAE
jgi:putative ABC transport system permease protein